MVSKRVILSLLLLTPWVSSVSAGRGSTPAGQTSLQVTPDGSTDSAASSFAEEKAAEMIAAEELRSLHEASQQNAAHKREGFFVPCAGSAKADQIACAFAWAEENKAASLVEEEERSAASLVEEEEEREAAASDAEEEALPAEASLLEEEELQAAIEEVDAEKEDKLIADTARLAGDDEEETETSLLEEGAAIAAATMKQATQRFLASLQLGDDAAKDAEKAIKAALAGLQAEKLQAIHVAKDASRDKEEAEKDAALKAASAAAAGLDSSTKERTDRLLRLQVELREEAENKIAAIKARQLEDMAAEEAKAWATFEDLALKGGADSKKAAESLKKELEKITADMLKLVEAAKAKARAAQKKAEDIKEKARQANAKAEDAKVAASLKSVSAKDAAEKNALNRLMETRMAMTERTVREYKDIADRATTALAAAKNILNSALTTAEDNAEQEFFAIAQKGSAASKKIADTMKKELAAIQGKMEADIAKADKEEEAAMKAAEDAKTKARDAQAQKEKDSLAKEAKSLAAKNAAMAENTEKLDHAKMDIKDSCAKEIEDAKANLMKKLADAEDEADDDFFDITVEGETKGLKVRDDLKKKLATLKTNRLAAYKKIETEADKKMKVVKTKVALVKEKKKDFFKQMGAVLKEINKGKPAATVKFTGIVNGINAMMTAFGEIKKANKEIEAAGYKSVQIALMGVIRIVNFHMVRAFGANEKTAPLWLALQAIGAKTEKKEFTTIMVTVNKLAIDHPVVEGEGFSYDLAGELKTVVMKLRKAAKK